MNPQIIKKVRENQPLIHHLTNQVVMNFTANGLLAFGAAPVMAKSCEEAADMASIAEGLLLNIGTLDSNDLKAMVLAGKAANKKGIPVVLDPVGVSATEFRLASVKQILKEVRVTAIKGNAGELAHLVNIPWETKGVESIGNGDVEEIVRIVAKEYDTAVVSTGKTDVICTENHLIYNVTGHPFLTKITGAGCLLGSILTACLTTDDAIEEQLATAVSFYGLAAQFAVSQTSVKGPGTFLPHFLDALSLEAEQLEER